MSIWRGYTTWKIPLVAMKFMIGSACLQVDEILICRILWFNCVGEVLVTCNDPDKNKGYFFEENQANEENDSLGLFFTGILLTTKLRIVIWIVWEFRLSAHDPHRRVIKEFKLSEPTRDGDGERVWKWSLWYFWVEYVWPEWDTLPTWAKTSEHLISLKRWSCGAFGCRYRWCW